MHVHMGHPWDVHSGRVNVGAPFRIVFCWQSAPTHGPALGRTLWQSERRDSVSHVLCWQTARVWGHPWNIQSGRATATVCSMCGLVACTCWPNASKCRTRLPPEGDVDMPSSSNRGARSSNPDLRRPGGPPTALTPGSSWKISGGDGGEPSSSSSAKATSTIASNNALVGMAAITLDRQIK